MPHISKVSNKVEALLAELRESSTTEGNIIAEAIQDFMDGWEEEEPLTTKEVRDFAIELREWARRVVDVLAVD